MAKESKRKLSNMSIYSNMIDMRYSKLQANENKYFIPSIKAIVKIVLA